MTRRLWYALRGVRVGLLMFLAMVVASLVVQSFSPYSPTTQAGTPLVPPSIEHLFGTDNLGRDVFTRTFSAARLDMWLAFAGVAPSLVVGTVVGAIIGSSTHRVVVGAVNALIDAINAFPLLALIIALIGFLGPGLMGMLIALSLTNWARYARIARARSEVVSDLEFIQAARTLGYSRGRIVGRHLIPNVSNVTLAYALSDIVIVILAVAGLSFLGLGVRPPTPEWGAMMSEGRIYLRQAWWIVVFPGLALSWTSASIAIVAEGLRRRRSGEL